MDGVGGIDPPLRISKTRALPLCYTPICTHEETRTLNPLGTGF